MTILAAMIGCSFLIVLASVGFGIQETLRNDILSQEEITKIELYGDETLSEKDREYIESVDHVNVVLNKAELDGIVSTSFEDRKGESTGVIYNTSELKQLPSNLNEGRLPEQANEIVVGYHFAQSLLNEEDRAIIEKKSKEAEEQDPITMVLRKAIKVIF